MNCNGKKKGESGKVGTWGHEADLSAFWGGGPERGIGEKGGWGGGGEQGEEGGGRAKSRLEVL